MQHRKTLHKVSLLLFCSLLAFASIVSCQNPSGSPASTDATLASLSLSSGTLSPSFASGTYSYTASVAASIASVTITASTTDSGATISGAGTATLNVGANTISVVVTAADKTSTKTYTITLTRGAASVPSASTDATLASLSLSSGTLSPSFASGTMSYTASVAKSVSSITVAATATDSGATLSGTGAVNLSEGTNAISIVVTAADGTTKQTYTVTVERASVISIGDYVGTWRTSTEGIFYTMLFDAAGNVTYVLSNGSGSETVFATAIVNNSSGEAQVAISSVLYQTPYNYDSSKDSLSAFNQLYARKSGTAGTIIGVWTFDRETLIIDNDYYFTSKSGEGILVDKGTVNTTTSKLSWSEPSTVTFTVTIDLSTNPNTIFEPIYKKTLSRQ